MADDTNRAIGTAAVGSLLLNAGVAVLGAVLFAISGDFVANLDHPIQFVGLATGLIAVVLFFVWVSLAHERAARISPDVKSARLWTVVGFFVPFLNLVHPYKVVSEIWRALTGTDARPVREWWLGTIGLFVAFFIAAALVAPADRIYLQVSAKIGTAMLCLGTAYIVARIERSKAS